MSSSTASGWRQNSTSTSNSNSNRCTTSKSAVMIGDQDNNNHNVAIAIDITTKNNKENMQAGPNTTKVECHPLHPILINNQTFPLPRSPSSTISVQSATTKFNTGINNRDGSSCIICNCEIRSCLEHAHIIEHTRRDIWQWLRDEARCICPGARSVEHESRNGILLCRNHHAAFDSHSYFIRWVSERNAYVSVNISESPYLALLHDHIIRLDPDNQRAPWPCYLRIGSGEVSMENSIDKFPSSV